jgi:hypothetical protein
MNDNNGSANAGNPAPGAGEGGAGASDQPWYSGIQDEGLRGYAQTKGFKDPAAVLESYRNFEKLQGVPQDRLLKLPEKDDDPAWGDIYGKLGRPSDPTGYQLQFEGDSALADRFAKTFHEAGISKSQAARLNTEWNAYVQELIEGDERERAQRSGAELAELRGKWGAKFDENAEMGRRAARQFGVAEDDFKQIEAALGPKKSLELFHRIGAGLGEAKSFNPEQGGGSSGFGMTAEAARARISSLTGDKDWTTKYLSGDRSAIDEMTRLQRIAAGES